MMSLQISPTKVVPTSENWHSSASRSGGTGNQGIEAILQKILRLLQQLASNQNGGTQSGESNGGGSKGHHSHASHHEHKHARDANQDDASSGDNGNRTSANNGAANDPNTHSSKSSASPTDNAHGNKNSGANDRRVSATPTTSTAAPQYVASGPQATPSSTAASSGDHSRETLAAGHGWGAQNGGVTGGSKADAAHVYTVSTREQLLAALGGNNATNGSNATPKIIQIKGNIDLNVDSNGKELAKGDFANEKAQLAHDMLNVGSNTTIIGLGANAGISGGGFNLSNQHNIIVRNLAMTSPFDFFPGKDAEGNPHGRVYSIEAKGTQNLWVDHNTFKDGATPSGAISGDQLDFTDGANYATVSYNQFQSHNKSILIGSSDGMTSDRGKLNVTIDHNLFAGVSQRDPRVRFGNVEVANNLYQDSSSQANRFQYNLGVGVESKITSQNNAFETNGVNEENLVKRFGASGHLTDSGSLVNGRSVDLSSSPTGSGPGAGSIAHLDPTNEVAAIVLAQSGAGKIDLGA
jgi:pectate lyase